MDRTILRKHLFFIEVWAARDQIQHGLIRTQGAMSAGTFKVFWIIKRHAEMITGVNRLSRFA